MDINVIIEQIQPLNQTLVQEAQTRFDNLIKPVGSLAKLEEMTARYAGILGSSDKKDMKYPKRAMLLWSSDAEAVVKAMQVEGTPVTVLAAQAEAESYPFFITANSLEEALEEGALLVKEYIDKNNLQMVAFGVLGKCQLIEDWQKKLEKEEFLEVCNDIIIAAMVGGMLQAAALKVPIMLDGVATCLAALAASKLQPLVSNYYFAGHLSTEVGHKEVLEVLQLAPPLRLEITQGSGEGAALALTLFDAGIKAYTEMETFAEAGVHAEVKEFSHAEQVKKKP